MTFQIYVGGQRVNSDFITSTPAWASQQVSLPAVKSRQSGFHPLQAVEGGASNDVEDPRTDPPRIPFSTSQPNKSRKRCSDDTDEAAMSAANSKRQQSSPLGSVTNLLVHGTEQ